MSINNNWCSQSQATHSYCSPHVEALTVICRPLYLPREITVVIIMAVYIPPDANVSIALNYLHGAISKQQQALPDGVHIVAGDFTRACLKAVLPKFIQYVKCATRKSRILDHVYCNIRHAYRAVPQHIGLSDHLSLHLIPAYTPHIRKNKPTTRTINTSPSSKTASQQQSGVYLRVWTWRSTQSLFYPTSHSVLEMSPSKNRPGSFRTRNPG